MENFDLLLAVQNGFLPQGTKLDSELLKQTLKYKDVISMIEKSKFCEEAWLKEECVKIGVKTNDWVTREGMAVLVASTLHKGQKPDVSSKILNYFIDSNRISEFARPYVGYVLLRGIYPLSPDKIYNPHIKIAMSEAVEILKYFTFKVIDLFATNDIHGKTEVMFDNQNQIQLGGMETIGGLINERRKLNPNATFVLDGGDAWQGTLLSNSSNGELILQIMESLQYDASVLGNHDFDFGIETLINNIKQSKVPILAANIVDCITGQKVPWSKPYIILERDELKVGIIGLVTTETVTTTKSKYIEGLKFIEPATIAQEIVGQLREQGCQIIIILSHQGIKLKMDVTEADQGELVDLAGSLQRGSVDAIIGGHVHQRFTKKINDIPVIIAESMTQALGHIQLFFDSNKQSVVFSKMNLVETHTKLTDGDSVVCSIVKKHKKRLEAKMNNVITETIEPIWGHSYRYEINGNIPRDGVNPLGDLIADAMREHEKTDIAFVNVGTIRAEIEKAGPVTYKDLYSILPLGNYNRIGKMNAMQLKKVLEVPDKYTGLPAMQFSGLKVEWDGSRAIGDRFIKIKLWDSTPIYVDGEFSKDIFTITTTDFMASGEGDGYTVFSEVTQWKDGELMLDAWIKHLQSKRKTQRFLKPPNDQRDIRIDIPFISST